MLANGEIYFKFDKMSEEYLSLFKECLKERKGVDYKIGLKGKLFTESIKEKVN